MDSPNPDTDIHLGKDEMIPIPVHRLWMNKNQPMFQMNQLLHVCHVTIPAEIESIHVQNWLLHLVQNAIHVFAARCNVQKWLLHWFRIGAMLLFSAQFYSFLAHNLIPT